MSQPEYILLLYLGYFVGNRIYFRISTHPEIMNFCRALIGKPDTFRNGKVSSRFQIVAPLFQASFKTNIINGSFRPDQVQRVLFKRKVIHRTDYAFHPILEIQFLGILVETFNESREKSMPVIFPGACCAKIIVCPPVPQPRSAIRDLSVRLSIKLNALRVTSGLPGPCRSVFKKNHKSNLHRILELYCCHYSLS